MGGQEAYCCTCLVEYQPFATTFSGAAASSPSGGAPIGPMQLERILRSQGFGSRAECRALVLAGRVSLGAQPVDDPDLELDPEGLTFRVDGQDWAYRTQVYLAMHKPAGYECSRQPQHHPSVYTLLPRPLLLRNTQAVGRLDVDTTGLLLFSDDGQFIHRCTAPKRALCKVYEIGTRHPLTADQLAALLDGVQLHGEAAPLCATACEQLAPCQLRLSVTFGKYHLVKRMVAAAGNRVDTLHRSAIGGLTLPADLPPGHWRWLSAADLERLT